MPQIIFIAAFASLIFGHAAKRLGEGVTATRKIGASGRDERAIRLSHHW